MIKFKCGLDTKRGFEYDSIPTKLQNALLKALQWNYKPFF